MDSKASGEYLISGLRQSFPEKVIFIFA